MATILGNSTLVHTNVSVDVLIETPDEGFAPAATPYILVGLHGGNGQLGGSSPGDFYRQGPDFDFAWFNVGEARGEGASVSLTRFGVPESPPTPPRLLALHALLQRASGGAPSRAQAPLATRPTRCRRASGTTRGTPSPSVSASWCS